MIKAVKDIYVDETIERTAEVHTGGNNPEREEWFRDLALGMFIHWNLDSPLGGEISHPMIGASDRILKQYLEDLPARFNPKNFDADDYAALAETVGMRYFCFTTKHHAGFCMYDTATNNFNVMNSRYGKDITGLFVDAFRERGMGVGLYFSPLDFYWLLNKGKKLQFMCDDVVPAHNPGLMEYNKTQLAELLGNYGKIDTVFFDGPADGLKEQTWNTDSDTIVTRGEMPTPEQYLPDKAIPEVWETCHTIGSQWNWKATHDVNHSGTELIKLLIETRAKGGNILINVTPDPYGRIPVEQDNILRELGLWIFWNKPAVYHARPWSHLREGDIWYSQEKGTGDIFAYIVDGVVWERGERREFTLKKVKATDKTKVELVGQNGQILEHSYGDRDISTRWRQTDRGLYISAVRCYRPYGNMKWHNPVVIRISNAEPA